MGRQFEPTGISNLQPVAGVCSGLVLYTRGPLGSSWDGLIDAWNFLVSTQRAALSCYRTWNETRWQPVDRGGFAELQGQIESHRGARPFWRCEVASGPDLPDVSIGFCDVLPTRGVERASFLRVCLPMATSPAVLFDLALHVAEMLPYWCGSAGFMFMHSEASKVLAFDQIWAWARRYWGVEVVDPEAGSWDVLGGLTSVNWLTLLGAEFLRERLPELSAEEAPDKVALRFLPSNGALVQAGAAPTLADVNRFELASAYAAAARWLDAGFIEKPTSFQGMFTDHDSTSAWIQRFHHPEGWLLSGRA